MTRRLTAWKLTSPWLRVPKGASRVRMVFSGRWKLQVPKAADTVQADPDLEDAKNAAEERAIR